MPNNRIQRGNVAELVVAAELSKRGYTVSLPISHNSHYDLIVDIGDKLVRLQVKRAYTQNNHGKTIRCVESRRISGKKRWAYRDNAFDYLVACDVDRSDVWFVPAEAASSYKAQIYLDAARCSPFLNAWL